MSSALQLPNIPIPLAVNQNMPPPPADSVLYLSGYPPKGATIYDRSGQENNGTIYGATWTRLPSGLWCLNFDGIDDKITFTNIAAYNITTNVSIETWCYPTGANDKDIVNKIASSQNTFSLRIRDTAVGGNKIRVYGTIATVEQYGDSNSGVTLNAWNHIVYTGASDTAKIYINGADVGYTQVVGTHVINLNLDANLIWGIYDVSAPFATSMAFQRLYNVTLTPAQVLEHYQQGHKYFGF